MQTVAKPLPAPERVPVAIVETKPPAAPAQPEVARRPGATGAPVTIKFPVKAASVSPLIERLRAIDWFQFETVLGLTYERQGYAVTRRGGAKPEGAIDLVLEKEGARTVLQWQHWRSGTVAEKTVRTLAEAKRAEGIKHGVLVVLGGCIGPARTLAEGLGIEILDEGHLAKMLEAAGADKDATVVALLQDERKYCRNCEAEMVLRTVSAGENAGSEYWGCSTFPECQHTVAAS